MLAHEADRAGRRASTTSRRRSSTRSTGCASRSTISSRTRERPFRARSFSGVCAISESVEGLVRALERLHADRGLTFDLDSIDPAIARGQSFDIDEMLGNLLDNACRWARARVSVITAAGRPNGLVTIDDDGPGLDKAMRDAVLRRGVERTSPAPVPAWAWRSSAISPTSTADRSRSVTPMRADSASSYGCLPERGNWYSTTGRTSMVAMLSSPRKPAAISIASSRLAASMSV